MIIQCRKCGTNFRFDETLIEGDGLWVRCKQCKNVFFRNSPAKKDAVPVSDQEKVREGERSEHKDTTKERITTNHKTEDVERGESLPVGDVRKAIGDLDKDKLISVEKEKAGEAHSDNEVLEKAIDTKRAMPRGKQLSYLFVVLILGILYLLFFAETGGQVLFEKIIGTTQKNEEVGPAQVELTDVRQRTVNNLLIGAIRVVEGTAINQSSFPMTRIKVKGEITDAYTVVLGVRESSCGNLLTDNELATMTEDQIQKELSNLQGSDVSNDRIGPQGQIPFMIVFTREPAGVVKTFVIPVGAERLLP